MYLCLSLPFSSDDDYVDLEKEFEENELNSAVYLISVAMQISNFAVNYKVKLSPLNMTVSGLLPTHSQSFMCIHMYMLCSLCCLYT